MTTIYLAQKLMSVKLDRNEFTKIKWLQKCTSQEKHTVVQSLKSLLKKDNQLKTCRLCLREGSVKILDNTTISQDIKYVLDIEVTEGDEKPQNICNECLGALEQAVCLKMTAEATQWRLQQEAELVFEAEAGLEEIGPEPRLQHGGFFTLRNGSNQVIRQWLCGKCRKVFHTEAEFADHENLPNCRLTTASDLNQRFVCEYCGQAFSGSMLLHRHRMIHTEEQGQFKCKFCPYRSHSQCKTKIHERSHTGERPYKCAVCGKAFSSPAGLWTHKKIHQPPKHHCQYCPKSYTHKRLLRDHIATQHCQDKPFTCQSCGKAFATRKKLYKHERGVHNRPAVQRRCPKQLMSNESIEDAN